MLKPHGFVVTIPHVRDCFRFFEKNFLWIFFNHAFGVTEPKEAPYVTTGNNLKFQALITLELKLILYLKRLQLFLNLIRMRKCRRRLTHELM